MTIKIKSAFENNLKNLSLDIPHDKITGITGVSGSGKSTLLKYVLAASGANNYVRLASKTVRTALTIKRNVEVESVSGLPQTIFIDVKGVLPNVNSTISTLSGIHETLRNLFVEFSEGICPTCGMRYNAFVTSKGPFSVDVVNDENYPRLTKYINKNGQILNEAFFNKDGNPVKKLVSARNATLTFSLKNPTKKRLKELCSEFSCKTYIEDGKVKYDPTLLARCEHCASLLPQIDRTRFSFLTPYEEGGGACSLCHGTGYTYGVQWSDLLIDEKKSILGGGVRFISEKGIAYTNINLSILKAIAKHYGIDPTKKISTLNQPALASFLNDETKITISMGRGKKKVIEFPGLISLLTMTVARGNKNCGELSKLCERRTCPACNGTRLHDAVDCFRLFGKTLSDLLSMTVDELGVWSGELVDSVPLKARGYLSRLSDKTKVLTRLSCGHLQLNRASNTLSGGELQRIRIGALLNSNLRGICYLIDEPSLGLHDHDVEILGVLFKDICSQGNTIIMVEHNRKLLSYCDFIVDLGPCGGAEGGRLLFSGEMKKFIQSNLATTKSLLEDRTLANKEDSKESFDSFMSFKNLKEHNLKNVDVDVPLRRFTVVCGISGSGKSTFLNEVVLKRVLLNPVKYGFKDVFPFSQNHSSGVVSSFVATILKISDYIAKLYAKESGFETSCFLLNTRIGKCPACAGKGMVYSEGGECLGICTACAGRRFSDNVLQVKINGLNISDTLSLALSELESHFDDQAIKNAAAVCNLLGIGYLFLARESSSLSKGELQRVRLANIMMKETSNNLILLDEPSKGLHFEDVKKLSRAIKNLLARNNTIIAVEHNPAMIGEADYIVEFGGTGKQGGHLIYSGLPGDLKNTPTAKVMSDRFALGNVRTKKSSREIVFHVATHIRKHQPNLVHQISQQQDDYLLLANKTQKDFLATTIQSNTLFSKISSDAIQLENAPLFLSVDFAEKLRSTSSVYEILGVRELMTTIVGQIYPEKKDVLKYVFDDTSPTGKCALCKGAGTITVVSPERFLEKSNLSPNTIKFLSRSLTFTEVAKKLRTKSRTNLQKPYSTMTSSEKDILLWGNIPDADQGNCWEGLISYFLHNHTYSPDQKWAEEIFSGRYEKSCSLCNGKRLKEEYLDYNLFGLSYCDLMTKDVLTILQVLNKCRLSTSHLDILKQMLMFLVKFGYPNISLAMQTAELDCVCSNIIKTISMYLHRIYGAGIVLANTNSLSLEQRKKLELLLLDWKRTNTIFIS